MIPIYNHPAPTPAMEQALHGALMHMSRKEGHLDSRNLPILQEGFRYESSVMEIVRHAADDGGFAYKDRSKSAHDLAKKLGYESTANCMAQVRAAVDNHMLTATVRNGEGWCMASAYGVEMLDLWENMD